MRSHSTWQLLLSAIMSVKLSTFGVNRIVLSQSLSLNPSVMVHCFSYVLILIRSTICTYPHRVWRKPFLFPFSFVNHGNKIDCTHHSLEARRFCKCAHIALYPTCRCFPLWLRVGRDYFAKPGFVYFTTGILQRWRLVSALSASLTF